MQGQPSPIMIDIKPSTSGDPTGLSQVLVGALGLSGALVLLAVALAAILAIGLFWWRSRTGLDVDPARSRDEHFL